jgi:hypothetical protein
MAPSAFEPLLRELCFRLPGSVGAVLIDDEGEAVDYTGSMAAYDIRVVGAHMRVLFDETRMVRTVDALRTLQIVGSRRVVVARAIHEDFAAVVVMRRRGCAHRNIATSRAFARFEWQVAREAGWSGTAYESWHDVRVVTGIDGRPLRVRDSATQWKPVDVLGRLARTDTGERGYRVRLRTGEELTLVREPGGFWYADVELGRAG